MLPLQSLLAAMWSINLPRIPRRCEWPDAISERASKTRGPQAWKSRKVENWIQAGSSQPRVRFEWQLPGQDLANASVTFKEASRKAGTSLRQTRDSGFTLEELCRSMWHSDKRHFLELAKEMSLTLFVTQFEREDAERLQKKRVRSRGS